MLLESAVSCAKDVIGSADALAICTKFTTEIETQGRIGEQLQGGGLICATSAHGTVFVPAPLVTKSPVALQSGMTVHLKALRTTCCPADMRAIDVSKEDSNGWQTSKTTKTKKNVKYRSKNNHEL